MNGLGKKGFGALFVIGAIFGCSSGGGGAGGGGQAVKDGAALEAGIIVPARLGDAACSPIDMNNSAAVLMLCFVDIESEKVAYAVWNGGESLEAVDIPNAFAGSSLNVMGLLDDGSIYGDIVDANGITAAGFISKNGSTAYLEKISIRAASPSGNYFVTTDSGGSFPPRYDLRRRNGALVVLSPLPEGLSSVDLTSVADSGLAGGTVSFSKPGQSFSAVYGLLHSTDRFDLIPAAGRPDLSFVISTQVNARGTAVLTYNSDTTFVDQYVDSDGNVTSQNAPVMHAMIVFSDGALASLDTDPSLQTTLLGLNDQDIALVVHLGRVGFEVPVGPSYVYSRRSGLRRLDEVIPAVGDHEGLLLNNKNQVLVANADHSSLRLFELPGEF